MQSKVELRASPSSTSLAASNGSYREAKYQKVQIKLKMQIKRKLIRADVQLQGQAEQVQVQHVCIRQLIKKYNSRASYFCLSHTSHIFQGFHSSLRLLPVIAHYLPSSTCLLLFLFFSQTAENILPIL